jgi:hypothetical protein
VNPSCAPLRFGTFPVEFGAQEAAFVCLRRGSGEPPPCAAIPPSGAAAPPPGRRGPSQAARSATNDPDQIGGYPLGPDPPWTRGPGPPPGAQPWPVAHRETNSPDQPTACQFRPCNGQPQPATATLQKRPCNL